MASFWSSCRSLAKVPSDLAIPDDPVGMPPMSSSSTIAITSSADSTYHNSFCVKPARLRNHAAKPAVEFSFNWSEPLVGKDLTFLVTMVVGKDLMEAFSASISAAPVTSPRFAMTIAASMPMMVITTKSSMSVKPFLDFFMAWYLVWVFTNRG